jgi:putative intracellular protease/amidase
MGAGALDLARVFVKAGTPLAAICGATWAIARAGLLDDRRHTSNAPEYIATSRHRGQALYVAERAVNDRGVITASATGALEFAREIFTQLEYYPGPTIEAWYQLYRTGDSKYYAELAKGTSGG